MADSNFWCKDCEENTDHTDISEGRIHICSKCGVETPFKKGYKPTERQQTKVVLDKIITEGKMTHLTDEQIDEIKKRMGEAKDKKEAGDIKRQLANEYGVSTWTIWNKCGGAKAKKVYKMGRHVKGVKAAPAPAPSEDGLGLKHRIERMIAEAVDRRLAGLGLESLDSKIEAAIARMLQ